MSVGNYTFAIGNIAHTITNYQIVYTGTVDVTVSPKALTVSLADAEQIYNGNALSTTVTTANGLVGQETISVTIATNGANATTYSYNGTPETQTGTFGGFVVSDLAISSANANFTITYNLSATIEKQQIDLELSGEKV